MELFIDLEDRALRADGVSIVDASQVTDLVMQQIPASKIRVLAMTKDIERYNTFVDESDELKIFDDAEPINLPMAWQLPPSYHELDLNEYIGTKFIDKVQHLNYSSEELQLAARRIDEELSQFEVRGMNMFLRTLIYVLETFEKNNVVWGVGRGSSCASYILFIIGLHLVDCIKYDVSLDEFFHD